MCMELDAFEDVTTWHMTNAIHNYLMGEETDKGVEWLNANMS